MRPGYLTLLLTLALPLAPPQPAGASSHREAPFVTEHPQVDATDLYVFRSYEAGREGYVTLLANYYPLQDPYGGPNYFALDQDARYVIHVDNTGDGVEDVSFVFQMDNRLPGLSIPVGGVQVAVPLKNVGTISRVLEPNLNFRETYQFRIVRGPLGDPTGHGNATAIGADVFVKPMDNIGTKSIPDYDAYEDQFIYDAAIPDCGISRVFVGQRREGFAVNLGEIFDLINVGNPVGDPDGERSATEYANVTTFALEVPISCVRGSGDVIGVWTSSWLPKNRILSSAPTFEDPDIETGPRVQVSRLGMPLVNEVVIGLPDKDLFNASAPRNDLQFATYVTNPTLPELIEILLGVPAPGNFPRQDLLAAFVTGIAGVNQFGFGEMVRLNTSIAPTPPAAQSNLGVLGGDAAGFPNGRRPGDDVVDIELRVAMGVLCHLGLGLCDPEDAPAGLLPYTDGALVEAAQFDDAFPYLRTPVPGSPNSQNGIGEK
jgi:hypothetical protein